MQWTDIGSSDEGVSFNSDGERDEAEVGEQCGEVELVARLCAIMVVLRAPPPHWPCAACQPVPDRPAAP